MNEFLIDLGSPENVARAIPHAKTLMLQAEQEATVAMEQAERAEEQANQARERAGKAKAEMQRWNTVLRTLEQLSADDDPDAAPAPPDTADVGNSTDRALRTVIAINGPTNIAEVAENMAGFSRKTVSWALWKLADEGVIQRLGHGRYAPLDYVPGRPTTDYLKLPPGFPTPSSQQVSQAAEAAREAARIRRLEDEQ